MGGVGEDLGIFSQADAAHLFADSENMICTTTQQMRITR
jgi:hypothetical protein